MNKNKDFPELYDIDIEKEYFECVAQISEEYLKYINSYKTLSKEYIKGLKNSHKIFEEKIKTIINELKNHKNINFSYILPLMYSIPNINKSFIENLNFLIKGVDNTIIDLEKYIKEKKYLIDKLINNLNDNKKDLSLKIIDMEKERVNLFNNLTQTENTISDFYTNKLKIENYSKENDGNINNNNSNNLKLLFLQNTNLEDIMNKSINETKKIENNYKSLISVSKVFKKSYIDLSNITYGNIRNILYDLFAEIKKFIENKIILLKNCFAIPLKEVDTKLSKLILNKENNEKLINNLILDSIIKTKDEFPIDSKKYSLQVFNNNINNNSNNKKPFMTIEDGLEEIKYLDNDLEFYTSKTMFSNFSFIEDEYKINFKEEDEKRKTYKLISNILSNIEKKHKKSDNKKNDNNIEDNKELKYIHENDIKQLYTLLDKHYNRVVFLQAISQFRTSQKYCLPLKVFDIIGNCLIIIINIMIRDKDYHCAKSAIILSQTYFCLKDNKRYYLHNIIKNNKIFSNLEFWEKTLDISIKKEIIRSQNIKNKKNGATVNKVGALEKEKDLDNEDFGDIAFGQIASIANSMIDFNINIKDIRSIIEPKEKLYKLNQNHIKNIELIIDNKLNSDKKEETNQKKENNDNIKNNIDVDNNDINTNTNNNNENKKEDLLGDNIVNNNNNQ